VVKKEERKERSLIRMNARHIVWRSESEGSRWRQIEQEAKTVESKRMLKRAGGFCDRNARERIKTQSENERCDQEEDTSENKIHRGEQ